MTPAEYAAVVAAEVRAEMARQHKGPGELAKHLKKSRPTVSARLSGDKPFAIDELMQIALWLGVPIEQLSPALTGGAA